MLMEDRRKEELFNIISRHSDWHNNKGVAENELARQALIKVLAFCRSSKPDKNLDIHASEGYIGYIRHLLTMREALANGLYMRACNELGNVIHDNPFFQRRILCNVIALLSEFLEEEDAQKKKSKKSRNTSKTRVPHRNGLFGVLLQYQR